MKLSIKTHGDVNLSKAVQTVLFANGYRWSSGASHHFANSQWLDLDAIAAGRLTWSNTQFHETALDARTEFGKLINTVNKIVSERAKLMEGK